MHALLPYHCARIKPSRARVPGGTVNKIEGEQHLLEIRRDFVLGNVQGL